MVELPAKVFDLDSSLMLGYVDPIIAIVCNGLKLVHLTLVLDQYVDEFVCIYLFIDLEVLDFVFKFLESVSFGGLELGKSLPLSLDFFDFLLLLIDNFFSSGK